MKSMLFALTGLGMTSFLGGCQYCCVTDAEKPGEGYVTHNWISRSHGDSGMRFINLKTDEEVILTSTRVENVSADEALAEVAAAKTRPR